MRLSWPGMLVPPANSISCQFLRGTLYISGKYSVPLHTLHTISSVYTGKVQCAPALCHSCVIQGIKSVYPTLLDSCVTQGRKSVPLRSLSPLVLYTGNKERTPYALSPQCGGSERSNSVSLSSSLLVLHELWHLCSTYHIRSFVQVPFDNRWNRHTYTSLTLLPFGLWAPDKTFLLFPDDNLS